MQKVFVYTLTVRTRRFTRAARTNELVFSAHRSATSNREKMKYFSHLLIKRKPASEPKTKRSTTLNFQANQSVKCLCLGPTSIWPQWNTSATEKSYYGSRFFAYTTQTCLVSSRSSKHLWCCKFLFTSKKPSFSAKHISGVKKFIKNIVKTRNRGLIFYNLDTSACRPIGCEDTSLANN